MKKTSAVRAHHHGNLKSEILEACLKAAEDGTLDQLSLREVAREIGVSPAAIYRHFESREDLMVTVARLGFERLVAMFEDAIPWDSRAKTPEEAKLRFLRLGQAYVRFAVENYALWRLMFGPHSRKLENPNAAENPTAYCYLRKALAELHHVGVIKEPTVEDEFHVWSTVHGISDLHATPAPVELPENPRLIEGACARLLKGLAPD